MLKAGDGSKALDRVRSTPVTLAAVEVAGSVYVGLSPRICHPASTSDAKHCPLPHDVRPPATSAQSASTWQGTHCPRALQRELLGSLRHGPLPCPAMHSHPSFSMPL